MHKLLPIASQMSQNNQKRIGIQALVACFFVLFVFGFGSANTASASCGDYLKHSDSMRGGHASDFSKNGLEDSPTPACGCKNGSCKSAPASLPTEPSRVIDLRKQPNQLSTSNFSSTDSLQGILINGNEILPTQPSLDILVPPPRAAFI